MSKGTKELLIGVVVIVLFGAFILYWSGQPEGRGPNFSRLVNNLQKTGDYTGALKALEEAKKSDTISADARARAIITGAGLAYETTGDIDAIITSIQELKAVAADPAVSPPIRANAELAVALWFQMSGNDGTVFDEIFKDDPYKQFGDNPSKVAAIRNLITSVEGSSTDPYIDMTIAGTYIKQAFERTLPNGDGNGLRKPALDRAEESLKQGEENMEQTLPTDITSQNYLSTLYWEAYTVGGLAYFREGDYKQQYKQKYEALISFLKDKATFDQKRRLAATIWRYGHYLMLVDKDDAAAEEKFKEAIAIVEANPNKDADSLVGLLRHIKYMKSKGSTAQGVVNLDKAMAISPELKAFVDGIQI